MLLRGLRWGLAGALVAWTLIRLLGLDRVWPVVPLFAFTPWVAALALLAAIVGAVLRWRLFALVCAASGLVLAVAIAPRVVPNRAPEDARGVRLRVLAANTGGVSLSAPELVQALRRWRVDVASLVELPPESVAAYDANGIGDVLPYRVLRPRPGFTGTGLYSRIPLREAPGPEGTRFTVSAASLAPRGAAPFELYAVHVPAPTSPGATADWRNDMRALPGTGEGGLRILAGDFNATLDHSELRRLLDRGYHDAAEQAGSGLRMTWPTDASPVPPLIAIDHVLADSRVRVASARRVAIPGSDHDGVLAELVLPDTDRAGG
jgi:endonuclease/exonuclease/phosphatase (EEP) superfamily protein YafD